MRILALTVASLLALSTFSAAQASESGLFIEPAVTYQSSDFDVNYPFAQSSGETDGFGLGARVGFHVSDSLFLGVDGRYSLLNFQDSNSVFNYDTKAKSYNIAPVIGIQMPVIGLRVWGSYIVSSTLDPDEKNSLDLKFDDGTGYRIGAGFHVATISFNLEYQKVDYDKTTFQQVGPVTNTATDNVKLKNEAWIASISFPISL
jgi:hypothetical protein